MTDTPVTHWIGGKPVTGFSSRTAPVLYGDHHIHGAEGIRLYTRAKALTHRWHGSARHDASYNSPTAE